MIGKMVWTLNNESETKTREVQTGYKEKSVFPFRKVDQVALRSCLVFIQIFRGFEDQGGHSLDHFGLTSQTTMPGAGGQTLKSSCPSVNYPLILI